MVDRFYDLPSVKSKRAAGFGIGDRTLQHSVSTENISPSTYNLQSEFQRNLLRKKGSSIGIKASLDFIFSSSKSNPGPANYQIPSTLSKQGGKLICLSGTKTDASQGFPGPGAYELRLTKNGKNVLSNHKSDMHTKISEGKLDRSLVTTERIPGPGNYNPSIQFLSAITQHTPLSFPKTARKVLLNLTDNPGPGQYNIPSTFKRK